MAAPGCAASAHAELYATAGDSQRLVVVLGGLAVTTGCEREPVLMPGVLIGANGNLVRLDPGAFKEDCELAATQNAVQGLGENWGLRVTIADMPYLSEDGRSWY